MVLQFVDERAASSKGNAAVASSSSAHEPPSPHIFWFTEELPASSSSSAYVTPIPLNFWFWSSPLTQLTKFTVIPVSRLMMQYKLRAHQQKISTMIVIGTSYCDV